LPQQQSRRPRADDGYLGPLHYFPLSIAGSNTAVASMAARLQ
jgi:hypothetical protein